MGKIAPPKIIFIQILTLLANFPTAVKGVFGGEYAKEGEFPHAVQLSHKLLGTYFCGGSIIEPNVILTAAHCLDSNRMFRRGVMPPEWIVVTAGSLKLNANGTSGKDDEEKQIRSVTRYIVHSKYPRSTNMIYAHDIALLFLQTAFNFTTKVNRIQLPSLPFEFYSEGIYAGWGHCKKNEEGLEYLNKTILPIAEKETCRLPYHFLSEEDFVICTRMVTEASVCNGDSGSALVCQEERTGLDEINGKKNSTPVVCGVGAWKSNAMSVVAFTYVLKYLDWIDTAMEMEGVVSTMKSSKNSTTKNMESSNQSGSGKELEKEAVETDFTTPKDEKATILRVDDRELANLEDFPYAVQLSFTTNGKFFCGGSILEPSVVVTAGNCFYDDYHLFEEGDIPAEWIRVTAGSQKVRENGQIVKEDGEQIRKVLRFVLHPEFSFDERKNDIALVFLETPFNFTEKINKIQLPSRSNQGFLNRTLAGWEVIEKDKYSRYDLHPSDPPREGLHKIHVDFGERDPCKAVADEDDICAQFKLNVDLYPGETGSPIVCKHDSNQNDASNTSSEVLCGIASWKWAYYWKETACDVFTDIPKYLCWIHETMEKEGFPSSSKFLGNCSQQSWNCEVNATTETSIILEGAIVSDEIERVSVEVEEENKEENKEDSDEIDDEQGNIGETSAEKDDKRAEKRNDVESERTCDAFKYWICFILILIAGIGVILFFKRKIVKPITCLV